MPNAYPFLYRVGMTPWDTQNDRGPITEIMLTRPSGRAFDAGCGTGRFAVDLALAGWQVVAVDSSEQPLRTARRRAQEAGLAATQCHFVKGDVARLDDVVDGAKFDLITDLGCFHGLTRYQQEAFARWVTANTAAGSELVVMAVEPRRGPGPKGLDEALLARLLSPTWSLVSVSESKNRAGRGPLKGSTFRWYRLRR